MKNHVVTLWQLFLLFLCHCSQVLSEQGTCGSAILPEGFLLHEFLSKDTTTTTTVLRTFVQDYPDESVPEG